MKFNRQSSRGLFGAALAALSLVAGARAAHAESQSFPVERMRGTLDAEGIIAIESGAVPGHLRWDLGIWGGYAANPLVVVKQATGERLTALVSDRVGGSVIASVGLFGRAQLGLEVPVIVYQQRPGGLIPEVTSKPLSDIAMGGPGDLRIVPKVALLQSRNGAPLDLALVLPFTVPTGGATAFRGDSGLTFSPELAASKRFGRTRIGANFAGTFRTGTAIANQSVGSELQLSVGAAYRFFDETSRKLPLELAASLSSATSMTSPFVNANEVPAEVRAQAGYWFSQACEGFVGGGAGLNAGWGTPDWRVFAGVRYSPRATLPVDSDGDGILDGDDKCPTVAEDKDGFEDSDGCIDPDNDQDGILDTADKCINTPEDKDGFEDGDGCPDPDNDGDGISDADDKCPNAAEDKDGFEDSDGCIDPDNDQDGILDTADKCINSPEDKDGFEDSDGCPDPDNDGDGILDADDKCPSQKGVKEVQGCPPPDRDADTVPDKTDNCPDEPGLPEFQGCKAKQLAAITNGRIDIIDQVYFKLNKDIIEQRSYELLENVAKVLSAHPEITKVVVEGHTDNQGKPAKNLDLSKRRAASVKKYLIGKGVPAARLDAQGYGQERPIASNDDEVGRAKNRRVVFTILDGTAIEKTNNGPTTDTIEKPAKGGKKKGSK